MFYNDVLIDSHAFPPTSAVATDTETNLLGPVTGPFTDEGEIVATFSGSKAQDLEATVEFEAHAVDEPTSLALLGIGVLSLVIGLRGRRGAIAA